MFKLVQSVTRGGFDPETGEFFCPVGADAAPHDDVADRGHSSSCGSALPQLSAARMGGLGWEQRVFAALFEVSHPGLKRVAQFDFFKGCRHGGVTFDAGRQAGVVVALPDSLASGCVSLVSVHAGHAAAFQGLQAALRCVRQQALQGYVRRREDDFLTEESTLDAASAAVHSLCQRHAAAAKQQHGRGGGGGGGGANVD